MHNYNHLYYFYETARLGSVTAAARVIGIQQPSLTIQLRNLEKEFKAALFKKAGRGIALTAFGENIYAVCKRMFEPANELKFVSENMDLVNPSRLRLGVSNDVARAYIVDLLSDVSIKLKVHGQPYILLQSEEHSDLVQMMKEGLLDAVVSTKADYTANIDLLGKRDIDVGLVVPYDLSDQISSNFAKQSWALPSVGTRLREEIDSFFESKKVTPIIGFESNVMASVIRAISDGLGSSIMPLNYVNQQVRLKKIKEALPGKILWKHTHWLMTVRTNKEIKSVDQLKKAFLQS